MNRRLFLLAIFVVQPYLPEPGSRLVAQNDPIEAETNPVEYSPPVIGPETEKRFPPLIVPDGFSATLYACDPLIEYPSVIAIGPRPGTLFVAHDYMTGLGVEIVRRDEVRLIDDTDGDGYADQSVLFAGGFNSIQGLAFHDGTVYVMHAPLLTALRDTSGDGIADDRRDLVTGLGLPSEENSNRLHCANGVVAGHDGWLYLSLGDRGCDVQRREGDRLVFQQGGILRCRLDGSDLHVFATGLRNIYDVALDEELNVFVRDNENDGGDYMIRVCHGFFGSDHGYPYHYHERPDEPMPPLADLGRGSSAGGTSYLETAFPQEYRDSLFFCEWGRAVVRYRKTRDGSSFQSMTEVDFAAGAADDKYGFKPTDLVVDEDGSLLVSDWADGQRPKRGRGRIYRIACTLQSEQGGEQDFNRDSTRLQPIPFDQLEVASLIRRLDAAGYQQRLAAQLELQRRGPAAVAAVVSAMQQGTPGPMGRLHGVWIIARSGAETATSDLFTIAQSDDDPRVCAQAIRAIGDLVDPILLEDRIDADRGDKAVGKRIAKIARSNPDPRVVLESLIVMRRLQWSAAPGWIADNLTLDQPALNHAATQTLRHCSNWPAVAELLDRSPRLRRLALHAMAEQRARSVADELITRLADADDPQLRREFCDALTRIVRKTKPWEYWGFRPAPRPVPTVDWEKTPAIIAALNAQLALPNLDLRAFVLARMLREGIAPELSTLASWLREDSDQARVEGILDALQVIDAKEVLPLLAETARRPTLPESCRIKALKGMIEQQSVDAGPHLVALAEQLEEGQVLARVIQEFGKRPQLDTSEILIKKLRSSHSAVRAEAIRALGRHGATDSRDHVANLLADSSHQVRLAAAEAAGELGAHDTANILLKFAADAEAPIARASLSSLRKLDDPRAIEAAVKGLEKSETQLAAVQYLLEFAGPAFLEPVVKSAATNLSIEYRDQLARLLMAWNDRYPESQSKLVRAIARVHGQTLQPVVWEIARTNSDEQALSLLERCSDPSNTDKEKANGDDRRVAQGTTATIRLTEDDGHEDTFAWVAWSPILVAEETPVEILTSATGELSVWFNGRQTYERKSPSEYQPDSDRIPVTLRDGMNVIALRIRSGEASPRFHLRLRRRSSKEKHERLTSFALHSQGNAQRGRKVFETEKFACINCHRIGTVGGRVGPDLSGIGRRFSRIHLIESILDPSRSIAPSYTTVAVVLNNGHVLTGVVMSETDESLVIADNTGKSHQILKDDIDQISERTTSIMPEGLEEQLTERELADLLAFLESLKTDNHPIPSD